MSFEKLNRKKSKLMDFFSGENVPLTPMLQKERMVDVIIAIDASADSKLLSIRDSRFSI